jgi:dipeptidyl aminopeptidase/acylaminoacyl peptidase
MAKKQLEDKLAVAQPELAGAATRTRLSSWLRLAGLAALGTAGSITLALGAASYPLSGLLIRPKLKRLSQLKSSHLRNLIRRAGIEFEDVTIRSFDSTRLYGWWMKAAPDAATVVVIHGVKKNRTDVMRAAMVLNRAGFNVLIFDGRAHGYSEGRYVTYGFYERRDVEAALEWLVTEKKIDRGRVGLAGESMGAAIALQVAAHNPWIRAVWADSPFASLRRVTEEFLRRVTGLPTALINPVLWSAIQMANYRGKFDVKTVDPLALAAEIKCPVFLAHGTADQLISTAHSQCIYDALGCQKQIWFVEGVRHARGIRHMKREYSERLSRFFIENLREESERL